MERKKKIQDALDRLFSRDRREPATPAPSEPARVRRDLFGTIPDDIPPNPPASAELTPVPEPAPVTPPPPVLPIVAPAASAVPVFSQPAPAAPAAVEPEPPVAQPAAAKPVIAAAAPAAAPSPATRSVEPPAVPAPVIIQAATAPVAPPVPAPDPKPVEAKPAPPARSAAPATTQAGGSVSKPTETMQAPPTALAGGAAAMTEAALNLKAEHHLVVFTLGSQYYGVDIAAVEGIIKMQPITIVPRTPSFVEGVTNLRGTVLPVFDLRKRFGLPRQEPTKDTRIVVIQLPGNTAGIIVDQVNEVLRIPEDAIEPPPPIAATTDTSYLMGIANVDNRFVILLDLSQVLTTEEKVILPSVG